jgi:hypothetical protein
MAAIVVVIMIFVDCGLWNYMRGKKRKRSGVKNDGKKKESSITQVQPVNDDGCNSSTDEVNNSLKS